jgi:hypothetical protein
MAVKDVNNISILLNLLKEASSIYRNKIYTHISCAAN